MEEKVKNFDKKLEEYENYTILMAKFVTYILEGIGIVIVMIPIQTIDRDSNVLPLTLLYLSAMAVSIRFHAYIDITDDAATMSIYKKLRYLPISPKTIFHVRFQSLLCPYCKKKLIVSLFAQIIITLIALHRISIWNFLYPVFLVALASFLPGLLRLYPWKRIKRKR